MLTLPVVLRQNDEDVFQTVEIHKGAHNRGEGQVVLAGFHSHHFAYGYVFG